MLEESGQRCIDVKRRSSLVPEYQGKQPIAVTLIGIFNRERKVCIFYDYFERRTERHWSQNLLTRIPSTECLVYRAGEDGIVTLFKLWVLPCCQGVECRDRQGNGLVLWAVGEVDLSHAVCPCVMEC